MNHLIAGILDKVAAMTVFLNPAENSYHRFGNGKAPKYISHSARTVHSLSEFLLLSANTVVLSFVHLIHPQILIWYSP